MKTRCPNCKSSDKIKEEDIGHKRKCWCCGEWYTVAEGEGALLPQENSPETDMSEIIIEKIEPKKIYKRVAIISAILVLIFLGVRHLHNLHYREDSQLWIGFCRHNFHQLAGYLVIYEYDNGQYPIADKWCDLLIEHHHFDDVIEKFAQATLLIEELDHGGISRLDGLEKDLLLLLGHSQRNDEALNLDHQTFHLIGEAEFILPGLPLKAGQCLTCGGNYLI